MKTKVKIIETGPTTATVVITTPDKLVFRISLSDLESNIKINLPDGRMAITPNFSNQITIERGND